MHCMPQIKKVSVLLGMLLGCLLFFCACGGGKDSGVKIGDRTFDADTTAVSITDAAFDDYAALSQLTRLSVLNLTALPLTPEKYEQISAQVGEDVTILWNVPLGEKQVPCTADALHLTESQLAQAAEALPYFTDLKSVTVEPCALSEDLCRVAETVRERFPDAQVKAGSQIAGVAVDTETEKVVLNKIKLSDSDIIRLAVRAFPNIKTYEMCQCGLSDDVMGKLREDFPDITFIWTVEFDRFSVRTDAVVFSTLEYEIFRNMTEETFRPLFTYCTELRALDIGHHGIKDLSGLANLKKLQVLILTDNPVSDISPLAELKDLKYLEINRSEVTDVTPLTKIDIEMLSLNENRHLQNIPELVKCQKLEGLFLFLTNMKKDEANTLLKGLPDGCYFNYGPSTPDFHTIFFEKKGIKVREAFRNWKNVESFDYNTKNMYVLK